jgi:hypothetical protein
LGWHVRFNLQPQCCWSSIGFFYAKVRKATWAAVTVQAQDIHAGGERIYSGNPLSGSNRNSGFRTQLRNMLYRIWGRHTICTKLHANSRFRCGLPFVTTLEEGFETRKAGMRCARTFLPQMSVCETRLI